MRRQATPWALFIPFALLWLAVWLSGRGDSRWG